MGENNTKQQLFLNGKPFDFNIVEIEPKPNDCQKSIAYFSPEKSFTVSFKPIYPKISRKYFVRRLEHMGYSKKYAKKIAWHFNKKKVPYGKAQMLMFIGGDSYFRTI